MIIYQGKYRKIQLKNIYWLSLQPKVPNLSKNITVLQKEKKHHIPPNYI